MSLTASRCMVNSVLVVPDGVPDSGPRERGFENPCNFPQPSNRSDWMSASLLVSTENFPRVNNMVR